MLFYEKVFLCKIVKDSSYKVGRVSKLDITFGGNNNLPIAESMFNTLKNMGIVPLFAYYVESKVISKGLEIFYSILDTTLDCSKVIINYRKVLLPNVLFKGELLDFISKEVSSLLEREVKVVSKEESVPSLIEIDRGIDFLRSLNSVGFNVFEAFIQKPSYLRSASPYIDNYAYCMIDDKTYILLTIEDDVREFAIVPLYYTNEEDILEYLSIITNKNRELLVEMLPYILK